MSGRHGQQIHKSGPLKQRNKSHKNGRHKSKGEISAAYKGRVEIKARSRKGLREVRKADRRNKQMQLRANKRQEVLLSKRQLGTGSHPPHLVVILSLSAKVDVGWIYSLLCGACDVDATPSTTPPAITLISHTLKQRFTLVFPPTDGDLYALLDVAKVADTLLLVHRAEEDIMPHFSLLLDSCMAQGLPTTIHLAQGMGSLTGRALTTAKKLIQRNMEARFPTDKLLLLDTVQEARTVLRTISTHKRRRVLCRDQHPHMLVDKLHFSPQKEGSGTLFLSGYVRSKALSVNSLIHIPGLGEYQMTQIDSPGDSCSFVTEKNTGMAVDEVDEDMDQDVNVLEVANPAKQESLESEVIPDPMAGEQTWPSEQELREVETTMRERKVTKRVPKGTSEYQATWILESEDKQDEDSTSGEEDMEEGEREEFSENEEESSEEELEELCSESNVNTMTLPDTDQYDADFDADAEKIQLQRLRSEREHILFPDEVDTPTDTPTRVRFQKYRGLKSFRSSPWDPLENLPSNYARIFQFQNFNLTKKKVLKQGESEGALPGWYVTLHVANVPSNYADKINEPMVVHSLLPHENKMSVLHFVLRRTKNYTLPIKSKDQLVFHTGVRRFSAAPIFSQHSTGDKHKFERFFPSGSSCVASVYAPIGYPPHPVLVFLHQEQQGGGERSVLVATGSLYKVDPQRVICKRIILSGHPYKINKRSAVIRYMFFNREDINWFKPVELRTKHGRRGHIKESLGTHGHMKCVFDGHLKAQDTVLMYLYKRVYPTWTYSSTLLRPVSWESGTNEDHRTEDSMQN